MARTLRTEETKTALTSATKDISENNHNLRPETKKSRLIDLLGQKDGCTVTAISTAFDWLPHTTRAAIAGLRKAGHHIETLSGEGGTRYRMRRSTNAGGR